MQGGKRKSGPTEMEIVKQEGEGGESTIHLEKCSLTKKRGEKGGGGLSGYGRN